MTGATSHQLHVGQVLADRYRIQRQIGHGGMGSVWEAEHIQLGTPVAIKVMRSEVAGGEHARARFLREARAAASLRSPSVVQVLDYGVEDDIPYIAMELLQGESLRERLKRTSTLAPQQVASLVEHVCRALTRAHAAGIVHRDLKPDNIFIVSEDEGEHYKVLDFGIAKQPTRGDNQASTAQGSMLGTPYYMAPEQARDASAAEARSDLWSMGVIAYECLLGRRPFDAESLAELSVQILVGDIPVPSHHGPVPEGFDGWFIRATARELPQRFADARELASTLNAVLCPSDRANPSANAVLVSPAPTRRWAAPAAATASAAAVGLAWFALKTSPPMPAGPADTPATTVSAVRQPDLDPPDPRPARLDTIAADRLDPSATVEVHLIGPRGARVYRDKKLLAVLPDRFAMTRGDMPVTLRVTAPGHADLELPLTPDGDLEHTITLLRSTDAATNKKKRPPVTRHDVEDLEF